MEAGDHIIGILGMPNSETSKWVGVALLQVSALPSGVPSGSTGGITPAAAKGSHDSPLTGDVHTGGDELPAQQPEPKKNYTGAAKSLARNPVFWSFVELKDNLQCKCAEEAEYWIELQCKVISCADIKYGTPAGDAMSRLLADFYKWQELNKQGKTQ